MNKKIIMIIVLIIFIVSIIALGVIINNKAKETVNNTKAENSKDVLEITDNYFIEQTNDIFYNTDDYLDKTVKMAGLIYTYEDDKTGKTYYAVIRNTPGCCGNDGLAGLDIRYDGEYPEKDTWVEVQGTIKKDKVGDEEIPAIYVTKMEQKEEGITFVTN